ncbi:MAG: hypothetical protein ACREJB_13350 [Planctomycetaceae bacterium]
MPDPFRDRQPSREVLPTAFLVGVLIGALAALVLVLVAQIAG